MEENPLPIVNKRGRPRLTEEQKAARKQRSIEKPKNMSTIQKDENFHCQPDSPIQEIHYGVTIAKTDAPIEPGAYSDTKTPLEIKQNEVLNKIGPINEIPLNNPCEKLTDITIPMPMVSPTTAPKIDIHSTTYTYPSENLIPKFIPDEPKSNQTPDLKILNVASDIAAPPVCWKRNGYGLLNHIKYSFNEDGSINWRSMINPKYLAPNKQYFKPDELAEIKNGEVDILSLPDNKLLILLAGIKDLARLRGYSSVSFNSIYSTDAFISLQCTIKWISNYETDSAVEFSSAADAHANNCSGFGKAFLTTIAENRAFVRCVRNFLGIHILGQDEISADINQPTDDAKTSNSPTSPYAALSKTISEAGLSFERFKKGMVDRHFVGAEAWESIDDIEKGKIFEIIGILKQHIDKKNGKTA